MMMDLKKAIGEYLVDGVKTFEITNLSFYVMVEDPHMG